MRASDEYIAAILKGTYLSRREKRAWAEEMRAHLAQSLEAQLQEGKSPDEARQAAVQAFGSVKEVRQRIIRETYGVSPRWFVMAAVVSIACIFFTWWMSVCLDDYDFATMTSIASPAWLSAASRHFILSPDAWIALTVFLAMYAFTRKRADRAMLFAFAVLLSGAWSVDRLTHHMGALGQVFFAQGTSLWIPPFGPPQIAGYALLFALSLAAYAWTRNRAVSLSLFVGTIAFTVWPYLANSVQAALYTATGNPIFWGKHLPDIYPVIWGLLTLAARAIVLFAFLYVCRRIDRGARARKAMTA